MDIQAELQKFHRLVNQYNAEVDEYKLFKQLFENNAFKLFTKKTSQAIIVFNFLENKYEYVSESIETISGMKASTIKEPDGVIKVVEAMAPESGQMMVQVLTPLMFEYCTKYPKDVPNMRFTACIQYNPKNQPNKWLLCHNTILCLTPDHLPLLSCTILSDITEMKNDTSLYYSIHIGEKLMLQKSIGQDALEFNLSERELDVVHCICKGKTTKEIADELHISFETVKKHRSNILAKTKCSNTPELINTLSYMGIM